MPDESEAASKSTAADGIGWLPLDQYPPEQRESTPEAPGWGMQDHPPAAEHRTEQDRDENEREQAPKGPPSAPRAAPEASGSARTSRRS